MSDPGLSLKATTLGSAFALLRSHGRDARGAETPEGNDAIDAIDALALDAGLRARRVLLDAGWWRTGAMPMVARVAERRRIARADGPVSEEGTGTGWVALVPAKPTGYRMVANDPDAGGPVAWAVDAATASRLAPYAFTFHERFPAQPLRARDLARFALRSGGPDVVLLVLAGLAAALLGLLAPAATGWLIDHAIPARDGGGIAGIIAALAGAGLALVALDLLRALAGVRFEARAAVAMQAALVDRVVSAPASLFRAFASGDMALRLGAVNTAQRALLQSTLSAFVTSFFVVANLAMMLAYSVPLAAVAIAVAALVVVVATVLGLRRLALGPRVEALDGRLGALTFELFSGIAKLRAAAVESRAFASWYARYDAFRHAGRAMAGLANAESVALGLLYPAASVLVLAMAWKVMGAGGLTAGEFVAFHTAMFALLGAVLALATEVLDIVNLKPLWDRARPLLAALPEDADAGRVKHAPQGSIEIDHVTFAYPGAPAVLHDVSLAIRPGEFVGIVGASGSGKSTLLRLLLGFESPRAGHVRYDGHDLAAIDLRHLRSRIGTVLQGGRLWEGDLLSNIVGATPYGVEEATEAARRAGLAADIEAMPMGLYTVVGEGLSTLSGGQRQRVLLARALIGDPRIVLLDEATSALDNLSQAAVLEELAALRATRVVIAHRLSTVRAADRIVVLDGGRIVQQGTYRELAEERGAFSAMLARQRA